MPLRPCSLPSRRLLYTSALRHDIPLRPTHRSGGVNLEIFKFGMYIMFPIGWMYYFGTNLDEKFNVPDFWPKKEETHRIPFEREEQLKLLEQMKVQRKRKKELRERVEMLEGGGRQVGAARELEGEEEAATAAAEAIAQQDGRATSGGRGLNRRFGRGAIEMWARGQA